MRKPLPENWDPTPLKLHHKQTDHYLPDHRIAVSGYSNDALSQVILESWEPRPGNEGWDHPNAYVIVLSRFINMTTHTLIVRWLRL